MDERMTDHKHCMITLITEVKYFSRGGRTIIRNLRGIYGKWCKCINTAVFSLWLRWAKNIRMQNCCQWSVNDDASFSIESLCMSMLFFTLLLYTRNPVKYDAFRDYLINLHVISRHDLTFKQWVGDSGPLSFWKVCDLSLYENQGWNHKTSLSFTRRGWV